MTEIVVPDISLFNRLQGLIGTRQGHLHLVGLSYQLLPNGLMKLGIRFDYITGTFFECYEESNWLDILSKGEEL